jgi:matrixin
MGIGAHRASPPAMAASRYLLLRLLACAALAVAVVPATAHAEANLAVPAAEPLMTTAHALAITRWGIDPCGGQAAVSWSHMGPGINARSQWMSLDAHDPTTYTECAVSFNLDVTWDWSKLCTVIEHELGHLTGREHVDDPHDVMSPYYVYPSPECRAPASAAPPAAPDVAPRKAPASRRAVAAAKRKALAKRKAESQRRANSHRKNKARPSTSKKRTSSKARKPRTKACVALAPSLSGSHAFVALPSADFSRPTFFGCVLVAGR